MSVLAQWLVIAALAVLCRLVFDRIERGEVGRPRRRGIAPPRRPGIELPPAFAWCGCCGQDCPPGDWWCLACRAHVGTEGRIEERTWSALHDGEECPYTPSQRDPVDEMSVPEGLGVWRRPAELREPRTPFERLPEAEQRLWIEAMKANSQ